MNNRITKEKLKKYFSITDIALKEAEKNINRKKEKEAKEILKMVSCYFSDAKYFYKQKNFVDAFACINYAHGWLDTGSRLEIFKVKNNKLFVIK